MRAFCGLLGILFLGAYFALTKYFVPNGSVPDLQYTLGGVDFTYTLLNGLGLGFIVAWAIMYTLGRPVSLGGVLGAGLCALYFVLTAPKTAEGAVGVTVAVTFCYLLGRLLPQKAAENASAAEKV